MNNEYLILAADAKESHRLQDELWAPSRNVLTVKSIHRGTLMGAGGVDVYYTDGALDALVRSAGEHGPTVTGAAIYVEADRAWRAWRRARPYLGAVRPLEAWLHLHEASREELVERRLDGSMVIAAHRHVSREQLDAARFPLDLVNHARAEVAAAVRNGARDRLIRIAPSRVIVGDFVQQDGSVRAAATWTARPAAERRVPEWLVSGLDAPSRAGVE